MESVSLHSPDRVPLQGERHQVPAVLQSLLHSDPVSPNTPQPSVLLYLGDHLQQVVAQVQLHQVGDALEAPADDDVDAAVPEVNLLKIVEIPVSQDSLVDPKQVVERQVEDLGGCLQHGDPGEGGVDTLHRLLASFPFTDTVVGTVALSGAVLK